MSNRIKYTPNGSAINVHLDGKIVGSIWPVSGGYRYYPTGKEFGGDCYPTLEACKQSLEAE